MQYVLTLPRLDWRLIVAAFVLLSLAFLLGSTMACSANLSHSGVMVKYLTKPIEKKAIQIQPKKAPPPIKNETKNIG